MGKWNN